LENKITLFDYTIYVPIEPAVSINPRT